MLALPPTWEKHRCLLINNKHLVSEEKEELELMLKSYPSLAGEPFFRVLTVV